MYFPSRNSLYINSIPYFAGLACLTGIRLFGYQYQGFIWSIFIIFGLFIIATKSRKTVVSFPWQIWLPWTVYLGLSLSWGSMQIRGNFQVFVQVVAPLLVGVIASISVTDDAQWNRLQRGFIHSLIFISFAFVYFWYGPPAQSTGAFGFGGVEAAGGIRGLGYGARPAGMTLAIVGCILLADIQKSKLRSLFLWGVCVVVASLSGSRMATIVLLLVSILSPLYRNVRTRFLAILLICFFAVGLFYTPMMQSRFFYSGEGKFSDIPTKNFADQGRLDFWAATLDEAMRHPVLGAGIGESDIFISSIFEIYQVHNDYLRILFELGVIGLGLFLLTICLQLAGLRKLMRLGSGEQRNAATAAYMGILTWLCFSVTDNPIIYNVFFTHPLFAIIGAAYGLSDRGLSHPQPPGSVNSSRSGGSGRPRSTAPPRAASAEGSP